MNEVSLIEEVFPAYPEYKESKVEWLGEVPATWDVRKLKYLIKSFESGVSVNSVDIPSKKHEKGILKTSSVYDYTFRPEENKTIVNETELKRAKVSPRKGEIIISRMNTPDLVGASGYVNKDYPNLFLPDRLWQTVFHRGVEINSKWLSFFFVSKQFRGLLSVMAIGTSSSMKNISQDNFLNTAIPLPPLSEQRQIAHFLDHKTAQIDAAIEKGRRLIELLREERAALINEAVTAGVDEHGRPRTKPTQLPAEEWKDSGVEWLGAVPEEWDTWKVSHAFTQIGSGTTPKSDQRKYYKDGDIPWVNTGDLNDSILKSCSKYVTQEALQDYSALKLFPKDSLIIAMYGATIGKVGILDFEATVNQACCVLAKSEVANIIFSYYWFLSNRRHVISLSLGGGQPNISQEILKSLVIPLPPLSEQKRIVEYIEAKTTRIDQEISILEREIELLAEYRQALISEAVTGKIDVREVEVDG